jgi:choline dehydrogenase-like flavoprotein
MVIAHPGWIQGPLDLRTDVCVVGSGIGGAVVAHQLARAGLDVIVLEEGGDPPVATSELEARTERLRDRGLQCTADRGAVVMQGRLLGGSWEVGQGTVLRVPDEDLLAWSRDRSVDTLSPGAMAEAYDEVEARLGAHRAGCRACGRCLGGCPAGSRRGVRDTWVEAASALGARFVLGCRAEHLRCVDGMVEGIAGHAFDGDAVRHKIRVRARTVVMAAGAIHTPSLMLISRVPDPHRTIGDQLRLQPTSVVVGRFAEDLPSAGAGRGVVTDFRGAEGGSHVLSPSPLPLETVCSGLPAWDGELARVLDRPRSTACVAVTVRDERTGWVVPLADGRPVIRYELAPPDRRAMAAGLADAARVLFAAGAVEVITSHGVPTVFRNEDDLAQLERRHYRACDLALYSTSPLGTCAMGSDPEVSVTDSRGRVYGVDGLYVADASLIPAAPGLPLGATVAALATQVAAGIVEERSRAGG